MRSVVACSAFLAFMLTAFVSTGSADTRKIEIGGFAVEQEVTVPVSPVVAFDYFTGDILPWWDHHFSEHPVRLWIEPFPGGRFYELFTHAGDGVVHATVLVADRGKQLRLDGPLGFSGHALHMVHTLDFEPIGDGSTRIKLSVHGAGELQEGWPEAVDQVWRHFLVEQFKPYVETRSSKTRSRRN